MSCVTTFDTYVRRRLDAWGTEFRLNRDGDFLGYPSKNILQILREHAGEVPERTTGRKPLLIPALEWQMETIVHDLHVDYPHLGWTLRAYYCGSGRVGVERLEALEAMLQRKVGKRAFFAYHNIGFHAVAGSLRAIAKNFS